MQALKKIFQKPSSIPREARDAKKTNHQKPNRKEFVGFSDKISSGGSP